MSVFGFSTEASAGGDFLPRINYDARAGRMFRVDRVDVGGQFSNEKIDITKNFKAQIDLENVETGWMDFGTGAAPVMALVPIGNALPPKPTPGSKNGVRVMLKLGKDIAGDKPIREITSSAKAYLAGVEALYLDWQANKAANPGKLPVVALEDTIPIKSGSGDKQSTNYQPVFKIVAWAPRGDLEFKPSGAPAASAPAAAAPSTGSTQVAPPAAKAKAPEPEFVDADDFG
jgi:hypothetical protein